MVGVAALTQATQGTVRLLTDRDRSLRGAKPSSTAAVLSFYASRLALLGSGESKRQHSVPALRAV